MTSCAALRLLRVALVFLLLVTAAQACGPDFSSDVFVRANRPDHPRQYVRGSLGLLQPSFPRADLLVAFRYLNGGLLDPAEQEGWQPTYDPDEPEWMQNAQQLYGPNAASPPPPLAQWVRARDAYPGAPPRTIGQQRTIQVHLQNNYTYNSHFLNCNDAAFTTAVATLADRANRWGKASPYFLDWLHAQDAVFSNCSAGANLPPAAPAGSPPLLLADRAYQTAAAQFYSQAYPPAAQAFLAISRDKASPWQPIAGYLAARVMIRQAFFARPDAGSPTADYDPALLAAAGKQLSAYLATRPSPQLQRAAEAQLALVDIRIEPDRRAHELSGLVAGPGHDPSYPQNLADLLWLADEKTPDGLRAEPDFYTEIADPADPKQMRPATRSQAIAVAMGSRERAYRATSGIRGVAPVLDWALTIQSLAPDAAAHAVAGWRQTHTLPWLVAALMLAPENSRVSDDLLAAAARVPIGSPAWQTVTYHRARLLLAAGHGEQAMPILSDALSRIEQLPAAERDLSSVNAFRGLSMLAQPTLTGFLSSAPQTVLLATSEEQSAVNECSEVMKNPDRHYDCVLKVLPEQLGPDAARVLNRQAPLSVWLEAAHSSQLSEQLRSAVADDGWTRAVFLNDRAAAAEFSPLLPAPLREQSGNGIGFAQWIAIARNPGLNPYLNSGTQRAYSYDYVESYRENWCYQSSGNANFNEEPDDTPVPRAAFLTPDAQRRGSQQAAALGPMHESSLAQEIVSAVKTNPNLPHADEALYLVLRMIRYGCVEAAAPPSAADRASPLPASIPPYQEEALRLYSAKEEAGLLMRKYFQHSPWTKKAAPYVG